MNYDMINPSHYVGVSGVESIAVIEGYGLNFHLGNAMKYILRAGKKPGQSPVQEIEKSRWFVSRAIVQSEIIRTTCFQEIAPGNFVADGTMNAADVIVEFQLSKNLAGPVASLLGMIANHGEVSNAVLRHLRNGLDAEIAELKKYHAVWGYHRGQAPTAGQAVSA